MTELDFIMKTCAIMNSYFWIPESYLLKKPMISPTTITDGFITFVSKGGSRVFFKSDKVKHYVSFCWFN